jgi:hypothetical protein
MTRHHGAWAPGAVIIAILGGCTGRHVVATDVSVSVIAVGPKNPASVAIDATHVYWTTSGTPTDPGVSSLLRVPKTGGEATTLLTNAGVLRRIAVDGTHVYATHYPFEILRVPSSGGAVEQIARTGDPPFDLAIDDERVYWVESPGHTLTVRSVPKAGGTSTIVMNKYDNLSVPSLVVDGEAVYVTEGNDRVARAEKLGGSPREITTMSHPLYLGLDADRLFSVDCSGECDTMTLHSIAKDGSWTALMAEHRGGEGGIAVGPDHVYWAGRYGPGRWGFVARFDKGTGQSSDIYQGQGPFAVAVEPDESAIYWVDFDTGEVYRALRH